MRAAVSTESALGPRGPLGLPLSERGFLLLVASSCAASARIPIFSRSPWQDSILPAHRSTRSVPSRTFCASSRSAADRVLQSLQAHVWFGDAHECNKMNRVRHPSGEEGCTCTLLVHSPAIAFTSCHAEEMSMHVLVMCQNATITLRNAITMQKRCGRPCCVCVVGVLCAMTCHMGCTHNAQMQQYVRAQYAS